MQYGAPVSVPWGWIRWITDPVKKWVPEFESYAQIPKERLVGQKTCKMEAATEQTYLGMMIKDGVNGKNPSAKQWKAA
jgi:hypothetical protein